MKKARAGAAGERKLAVHCPCGGRSRHPWNRPHRPPRLAHRAAQPCRAARGGAVAGAGAHVPVCDPPVEEERFCRSLGLTNSLSWGREQNARLLCKASSCRLRHHSARLPNHPCAELLCTSLRPAFPAPWCYKKNVQGAAITDSTRQEFIRGQFRCGRPGAPGRPPDGARWRHPTPPARGGSARRQRRAAAACPKRLAGSGSSKASELSSLGLSGRLDDVHKLGLEGGAAHLEWGGGE